jgi:hypothetical protein
MISNVGISSIHSHVTGSAFACVLEYPIVSKTISVAVLFSALTGEQQNRRGLLWRTDSAVVLAAKLHVKFTTSIILTWY